jgi:hypothetical protein
MFNRAKMTVTVGGAGTITLGVASTGYQTFTSAGVTNGDTISYVIEDGTAWEYGSGVYTATGTTLARTLGQSSTGSLLNVTTAATVFITALASDLTSTDNLTSGTLPVGRGGTGATTLTGVLKGNGTSAFTAATAGTDYVAPGGALGTPSSGTLTNCTFPTLNQNTTGTAAGLSSTLVATSGGTGQSSYAVGDLLYASTTTALSKLADVATGNALISGGVGVAPSWGKIALTTHISGTLPVANGGTNATSAGITAFNNITGYTAAGATGTTSTNLVFSTSPTITTGVLTGMRETKTAPTISAGTLTIDCSAGNVFAVSLNAAITTLSFTNVPASGTAFGLTLAFTADGTARAITWGASVKWPGGTAPTLTSTNAKVDTFVLYTHDGGTTWYAFTAGQNA